MNRLTEISLLFIVFTFLLCSNSAQSANYYVSVSQGDDTNPGTETAPFKTIAKASAVLVAGDVCYIKAGTYRETIIAAKSGTAGQPITYKSFENDQVIISATEPVSNWSVYSGNVYKASVEMSLNEQNMIYFRGKDMDWARWPNNTDGNRFTIDAEVVDNGTESQIQSNKIPNLDWSGGYVWYLGGHCGTSWTRPITSSSSGKIDFQAVDITKWPFNPHNPTIVRNNNRGRFYLFGTLQALDNPGEWFYDSKQKTLYFQAPENVRPAATDVEYAARKEAINLSSNYLVISGLTVFGGRVQISGNNCVVRNCNIVHGLETLDELNNTDAQIANGSINIEGSNTLIENNLIEYGSANGIAMLYAWKGSTANVVKNNIIRYFNSLGVHSNPIRSSCTETTVTGNTIYSCGRDGIYVSGANSEISWNDVSDCMLINNDGGVFYTVGNASPKNSVIHHNWFHDSYGPAYADGRAAGIYLDNDSKSYTVHHNVVWNITWSGVQMNWDNWNNNIFNNTLWNVGGAMANWLNGRTLIDNKIYNNYANAGEWVGNDFKANYIGAVSQFVSVENKNFMPVQGSILIDNGILIAGITDGYLGSQPDLGAYEFGGERWIPGVNWTEPVFTSKVELKTLNTGFEVFPNPVSDWMKIRFNNPAADLKLIQIYTIQGKLVLSQIQENKLNLTEFRIARGNLTSGVYLVKLCGSNWSESKKVILQ